MLNRNLFPKRPLSIKEQLEPLQATERVFLMPVREDRRRQFFGGDMHALARDHIAMQCHLIEVRAQIKQLEAELVVEEAEAALATAHVAPEAAPPASKKARH